jgi:hypothetical protein
VAFDGLKLWRMPCVFRLLNARNLRWHSAKSPYDPERGFHVAILTSYCSFPQLFIIFLRYMLQISIFAESLFENVSDELP